MNNDKEFKKDLLIIYKLYLYALREQQEYGDKYGDTDELIKMYEEILTSNNQFVCERENNKIKRLYKCPPNCNQKKD